MKVSIHLANNFEEVEAISVIDVLRRANVDLTVVSIQDKLKVTGDHGVEVTADKLFKDVNYDDMDMIILPGGAGTKNLAAHDDLKKKIKEFSEQNKYLAAICAAPTVLSKAGVLSNETVVCYPGFEKDLGNDVKIGKKDVVQSNKIITSKGPGTALKFALKLVEIIKGKKLSKKLEKGMLIK